MDVTIIYALISLIPVLVLALVVMLLIRWFTNSYNLQLRAFAHHEQKKQMVALRTQACERLTIYLERINAQSLIIREQHHHMTSKDFHAHLLKMVRTEFEHNLAVQIYISGDTWLAVKQAKDEMIKVINTCAAQTNPAFPSVVLGQAIIEQAPAVAFAQNKAIEKIKYEISLL
jgi:hypothetical protein